MNPQHYALAPSQHIFWAQHQIFPEGAIGNLAIRLRLRGPLRHDAMLSAIQRLAQRFDLWRTHYRVQPGGGGEPTAVVEAMQRYPIDAVDLAALPPPEREARLHALLHERLHTRFDLAGDPMMRVSFVRMADDDHALQLCTHHIAVDGISLHDVLGRALADEYRAALHGQPPRPQCAPGFAELAAAQRQKYSDPARESLAFWRAHLQDAQIALDLPTDKPRPRLRGFRGARESLVLSDALRQRLVERAQQLGGSLADLLLSAFYLQLSTYSGQTDLLVGVANGNRRDAHLHDAYGCLVVTVPVRCQLHDEPSLSELIGRVRAAKRAAYAHLDPAIDEVLAELSGGGDGRRSSGYQAVFNYMPYSLHDLQFEGLRLEPERPDPGWSAVDLSLDVHVRRGELVCTLEYARELFEPATAARYMQHYANALHQLGDPGNTHPAQLSWLDDQERRTVLETFNATTRPYPSDRCLHEVVGEALQARPDAVAVTDGHRELSNAQLLGRSAQLCARLQAASAAPDQRVLLLLEDPIDALVAMLATLQSGAAYVPLDPNLPRERLNTVLSTVAPVAIVVADEAQRAELAQAGCEVLTMSGPASASPALSAPSAPRRATPDDPAYVIFTSGSTGVPKGVVVRHRNVVSQLFARIHGYPGEPPLRMLLPHSFAFDAPIGGLYWTLAAGGTLVLPGEAGRRDPDVISRLIERFAVTHMDIVPSLYAELLAIEQPGRLRSLTTVLIGGEACSAALARRHHALLPQTRLYNEYGPTETTVYSTSCLLAGDALHDPLPIGRPIANTRCYVLDRRGRPTPLGIPGELFIGGAGVALGYFNDPERTAERFVADAFSPDPGARMYRTGDVVRLRADGNLEFLARGDRQVKVRGYRIELGEIEAALCRRPHVARAVAVARRDESGGHIDAYVTLKQAASSPAHATRLAGELRTALRAELPAYMVPSHVQVLERIPTTAAGKLDEKALPAPSSDAAMADDRRRYVEPRTQTEQRLARLWSELLGVPRVGMLDDFFELGGHSLLAVRMLSQVASHEGAHVALSTFFHRPSVEHLAAQLHSTALPEESLIVTIQEGSRPPFWLPHPVGGHVVFARRLALHLDPDQPLLGIQAQGLDGHREPLTTIEAMAERYVGLMREVQPHGPYYLGGHSLGGLIAFELAQRLHRMGEPIGMLALFDTPGPNYPRRASLPVRLMDHAILRAAQLRDRLLHPGAAQPAAAAAELEAYRNYDPLRAEQQRGALVDAIDRVKQCNTQAGLQYERRYYPGPILFFRAAQTPSWPGMRFDDPHCGWGALASRVEVVPVDCTHQNMMDEPGVAELGQKLQARLRAVQQQHATTPVCSSRSIGGG